MADPGATDDLRPRPTDPYNYIVVGIVVSMIGGALFSADIVIGPLLLMVGGPILLVGLIAQGVLVGARMADYQEYLSRLIEAGEDEG